MAPPKVALIVVASPVESGGERGEDLLRQATRNLRDGGLEVIGPTDIVWGKVDATGAIDALRAQDPDLLVIVHASWVVDTLQFQLIRELNRPVMLWAVPHAETFALASVKHFASVAHHNGLLYRWGQGALSGPDFRDRVAAVAQASAVARQLRRARVGLITPRATWRTTGLMDMTYDDWDLGEQLGITLQHLDFDELIAIAEKKSDADAHGEIERHPGYGWVEAGDARMVFSAKVYLAIKDLAAEYGLRTIAAACYPKQFGLVNLGSAWLADEGFYLDPEGDVGSAIVASTLMALQPGPVTLAEPALIPEDRDTLILRHEGSSPASLAAAPSQVHVIDLGDATGTLIEFGLRKIETLTAASLCGRKGDYQLWAGRLTSLGMEPEEWSRVGRGFLAEVSAEGGGRRLIDRMFSTGQAHHMLLQEGDATRQLADIAEMWGVGFVPMVG